jgi:acid phosphatase family membrane protein YuiD
VPFSAILQNNMLWSAVLSWTLAQVYKFLTQIIRDRRLDFRMLVAPGGMPSGHSASMMALTTAVGIEIGFDSAAFAVAFVTSMIVMYDAAGIRRSAGQQAVVLNRIVHRLSQGVHEEKVQLSAQELKEILGHTPFQVIVGAAMGIVIALIFCLRG